MKGGLSLWVGGGLVALALYGSWAALIWFHAALPWWILYPALGYVVAWHFSLQHEAIHSFLSSNPATSGRSFPT